LSFNISDLTVIYKASKKRCVQPTPPFSSPLSATIFLAFFQPSHRITTRSTHALLQPLHHSFDEDEAFKERARLAVVALQSGDPGCRAIWTLLCDISRAEFQKVPIPTQAPTLLDPVQLDSLESFSQASLWPLSGLSPAPLSLLSISPFLGPTPHPHRPTTATPTTYW